MRNSFHHHKLVFAGLLLAALALPATADTATGVVYHDENGNGQRDAHERGLGEVAVSNGEDVVLTDRDGAWSLPASEDCIFFVIQPEDWSVPVSGKGNLPQFYYIHKPKGSPDLKYGGVPPTGPLPESINFPLVRGEDADAFKMICLGDPQPRNQAEVDFLSHDVYEELLEVDGAAMGAALGDLVFDGLELFPSIIEQGGLLGVPMYHVIGNHDINFDAPTPAQANETYEAHFGPSYYSFNRGDVHFIVMDNVMWDPKERRYHGEFGPKQLKFVENDLKHVEKDKLIVPMMHIALWGTDDADALLALLEPFEHSLSLSAHTHFQRSDFMPMGAGVTKHHHLNHVTACGSWQGGMFDELGLPHTTMRDGGPNGYSLISFDENQYKVTFKAARRPANHQMSIWTPEVVESDTAHEHEVVVNVFAGNENSVVKMQVDNGDWVLLRDREGIDPYYQEIWERQFKLITKIAKDSGRDHTDEDVLRKIAGEYAPLLGRGMPEPKETNHLWYAPLPGGLESGYHVITVETTDMYGQTYTDKRIFRVE
jgi:hypothetical protein